MNYRIPTLDKWEWQKSVIDKDLTSPPLSPVKGDRYLIYGVGSGVWIGQDGNIAEYDGTSWFFITKQEGILVYVKDEVLWYCYVTFWIEFPLQFVTSKVRAFQSIAQSIPAATYTKVNLQSKVYDTLNEFSNSRFTATQVGWYHIDGSVVAKISVPTGGTCLIYVNGVMVTANYAYGGAGSPNPTVSDSIYLNVEDYIELYCYITRACTLYALAVQTYMTIHRI